MLVLALDTTTRSGSCAIARDGRVLREDAGDGSKAQAERLPADLQVLLEQEGIVLSAIDVYSVSIGPGSFTGLRVGIATMQGLAFAAGKPLVGISAFDALNAVAEAHGHGARVSTWISAWRGEVYAGLYEDGREVDPPSVGRPDELLARLSGRPTVFVGDGAETYAAAIRAAFGAEATIVDPVAPLLAGVIAQRATDAARAGQLPPPHAIRPLYVSRPGAPRPV